MPDLHLTLQIINWVLYIRPLQPQAQSGHIDIYVERPIELEGIWHSDNLRDLMTGNLFGAYPVHVYKQWNSQNQSSVKKLMN